MFINTVLAQCKLPAVVALQVIYERLGDSQQFREATVRHLEEFAAEGLRTLCYAVADISAEFYEVIS